MAITINGTGTITGISAGGLPDGVITSDDLASGAITSAGLPAGSIIGVYQDKFESREVLSVANGNSSTNPTWTDSSLDLTISPVSAGSNFIVIADIKASATFNYTWRIYDVTASSIIYGVKVGSYRHAASGALVSGNGTGGNKHAAATSVVYYNPASNASSRQFKIQFLGTSASGSVNLGGTTAINDSAFNTNAPCSLTVLEVAV